LFGDQSLELVKPLEGMLRLQYHFASLQRDSASHNSFDNTNYRQTTALGGVYRRGEAVLTNIYALKRFNGSSPGEQARDLTRLGDWAWWMGRRSHAYNYYEQAWQRITPPPEPPIEVDTPADASTDNEQPLPPAEDAEPTVAAVENGTPAEPSPQDDEVAASDAPPSEPEPEPVDDPVMRAALFETTTPLPDIDSLRPLPPFIRSDAGPVVVQFRVNESGKVTDLERLAVKEVSETEQSESENMAGEPAELESEALEVAVERLFRKMRRARFRPQYEAGEPVDTDMIVWSFDLTPPGADSTALQPQ
jgi:hypothetical protein